MDKLREVDLRSLKEFFKDSFKYIIVAFSVFILFLYVVSFQQVIGPSMEPNYNEGEIYLLNKIKFKFTDPKRFDVVVVDTESSKYMIKRVIGLPREKLEYKDNSLYINDKLVIENFDRTGVTEDFNISILESEYIPEGSYFVLGDNRENSTDSRKFGFVNKDDIIGKVEFRLWPII